MGHVWQLILRLCIQTINPTQDPCYNAIVNLTNNQCFVNDLITWPWCVTIKMQI